MKLTGNNKSYVPYVTMWFSKRFVKQILLIN